MPKVKKSKEKRTHDPLEVDILSDIQVKPKSKQKRKRNDESEHSTREQATFTKLDPRVNKMLLEEEEKEEEDEEEGDNFSNRKQQRQAPSSSFEIDDLEDEPEDKKEDQELDEDDAKLLSMFKSSTSSQQGGNKTSLTEAILQKIREKESASGQQDQSQTQLDVERRLPKKVVATYRQIGKVFSKYKSGKIPKAFKVVPALSNWEEILLLTKPDTWTPHATLAATRLFAASCNEKMAQRFYNMVLLPMIRNDIAANNKLNVHLFEALRKSCFKPGAFFKGIVLPLLECASCTLTEATVIGGIIKRTSIPILHSAAALLKILTMPEYNGPSMIVIKSLIEKRYAMPTKVVESFVSYFYRFCSDERALPVLWHQAVLIFVQLYKQELSREQKNKLFTVCRKHNHHLITAEIRKELTSASAAVEQPMEQ